MIAQITERLNEPDNIEIIRDQIAAIIKLEMDNQYDLAVADDDPVMDDYHCEVLIQNDEPLSAGGDRDLFPCVNVVYDKSDADNAGSASVNKSKQTAVFFIDCYQSGNSSGIFAGRNAALKAMKLARCVRKILDSDAYTYLKLRGIVGGVQIVKQDVGSVGMTESAGKVVLDRLTVNVSYDCDAPVQNGEMMEIMPVVISDENGQVVG